MLKRSEQEGAWNRMSQDKGVSAGSGRALSAAVMTLGFIRGLMSSQWILNRVTQSDLTLGETTVTSDADWIGGHEGGATPP